MSVLPTATIGRTTVRVSALGLGTTALANMYEAVAPASVGATLDAAWDAGVRYFDTAPAYGSGLAEQRLGAWLQSRPRDEMTLSTKVGNSLVPIPEGDEGPGLFPGALPAQPVPDFSRDAILRSLEQSLERLGTDRVDMVAIHDPDGAASIEPGVDPYARSRFREAMDECYPALDELRSQGVIGAVGVGMNGWQMLVDFARAGDFDYFLLAGRHTLLEQEAQQELFPVCEEREISLVIGGPYSSGILATGPGPDARYNYAPAPPDVQERVAAIERVAVKHGVSLRALALRFTVGHPAVASVIPGARSVAEVAENAALFAAEIPDEVWDDLVAAGVLRLRPDERSAVEAHRP
jgi:D-threo-aldose 1-dehydrogenase